MNIPSLERLPAWPAQLALRVALAIPFLRSGLTKWEGWFDLSGSTAYLFTHEFRLHVLGAQIAYPFPGVMAWLAAIAEIVLPALLIAGLTTRLAAAGLLAMTAVIQLTVPDGWANFHLPWAAMSLALMTWGGGSLSVDHFLRR